MRWRAESFLNALLVLAFLGFLVWAQRTLDDYKLRILNLVAINTVAALGLNLIYGFTGMFSLGHAGFMAVGAYTCALLIMSPLQKKMTFIIAPLIEPLASVQWPFLPALLLGGIVAALFALLIGMPVLKLSGDYLGIATLGFAEIIRVVANNVPWLTNGALGLKGIPSHANLYWNWGVALFSLFVVVNIARSNVGNVLKAIRDDEVAARAMGVDTYRYRVLAFTLGGFFAGLAGGLLGSLLTTIDPKTFTFFLTFNVLTIVVAGGLGSITGTVLSAAAFTVLLEWLRFVESPTTVFGIHIPGISGMRMVVFSLLLIAIILFRQEGFLGDREITWSSLRAALARRGGRS